MAERVRLLVVIPNLEIGGAERQITLLLKWLDRSHYRLGLVCCQMQGPLVSEVPGDVQLFNLAKRSRWDFPWLIGRLLRVMREFEPDIVLASLDYAVLLAWSAKAFRGGRGRLIARKEVMPSQSRRGEKWRRPKLWLDRHVQRRVDMIIAPAVGILEELTPFLGGRSIPLVKIPNAVDLDFISRALSSSGASRPRDRSLIVAMGRLVPWKGFALLIRALALLPRNCVTLRLIGDGPERARLEALAVSVGVRDEVEFTGYHANPFPLLQGAILGVLPSEFEPFGNVIVEMFAAGLPVVAYDVNYGPREIIRPENNGLLVGPVEPKPLADAILSLLENRAARDRMAEGALREARERYSIQSVITRYQSCFEYLGARGPLPSEPLDASVVRPEPEARGGAYGRERAMHQ